ncbi:hypothetical protein ACJMK2_036225 [Sinanodonta woodiana]|uniref:Uncharacterized protein n=1 Tax=Sinanodonta woodiana TaxID=1069815 RepID=A0ABD3WGK7_SINWO
MKETQKISTSSKLDSKDNLVSSSIMLVNNTGSGHIGSYYDPRLMYPPGHSGGHEDYAYGGFERYTPAGHSIYYPYGHIEMASVRECTCPQVPVENTFLHQILTGKGYKNYCLFVTPPIKQEAPDYLEGYSCCGYSMPSYGFSYHGYPMYH